MWLSGAGCKAIGCTSLTLPFCASLLATLFARPWGLSQARREPHRRGLEIVLADRELRGFSTERPGNGGAKKVKNTPRPLPARKSSACGPSCVLVLPLLRRTPCRRQQTVKCVLVLPLLRRTPCRRQQTVNESQTRASRPCCFLSFSRALCSWNASCLVPSSQARTGLSRAGPAALASLLAWRSC